MTETERSDVVTCFIKNQSEVLLFRRSDEAGSHSGRWSGVSGYIEEEERTIDAALREIEEETGISDVELVRQGESFEVADKEIRWRIHPFLFDSPTREIDMNYENSNYEWVSPPEILERDTVPELWGSYDRVRPKLIDVKQDEEHGSAYISIRGLELLRDSSAIEEDFEVVKSTAKRIIEARPKMASLRNRVNKVMHDANSVAEVRQKAEEVIDESVVADEKAAENGASKISNRKVFTLSRSGTVINSVVKGEDVEVVVAESRPGKEGVGVAEEFTEKGIETTLITDANIAQAVSDSEVDCVLVGADSVLRDGRLVNKTGTRVAGIVADYEGIDLFAVTSIDKIVPESKREEGIEDASPDIYDGEESLKTENPLFDVTPPELVTAYITEEGFKTPEEIVDVAQRLEKFSDW